MADDGTATAAPLRNKENRTGSASGTRAVASDGGDSDASPPSHHSHGREGRVRLRESTNTRGIGVASATASSGTAHVGAALGCQTHGAPPASRAEYYQLSSRGGAAQPLTDMDFVQQLLGAGPAAGAAVGSARKRSPNSAGGQRSASVAAAGAAANLSKSRPTSYSRTGPQRSVQAW